MKKNLIILLSLIGLFFFSGCYHANVSTGLEPSAHVIEKSFASAWVYGLVPPSVVQAQNQCRNGVARVETKLSFVNMLVGNLTFGLYTPMNIKVTCAASRAEVSSKDSDLYTINRADSEEKVNEVLLSATKKSLESNQPFYIDMK